MLKKTTLLFALLTCIAFSSATGQSTKQKLRKAKDFFYHEKYSEALAVLSSSRQLSRNDKEGRFLMAVCHYQLNQLNLSLEVLNEIAEEKKTPYPECWLYTAKIHHSFHKFAEAAKYYKLYLRTLRPKHKHRQMVREEIRRCANGIEIQFRQTSAIVENLGPKVNTESDEFAPIPSRNRVDKLYFSSMRYGNIGGARGKNNQKDERYGTFLSDMFSCWVKKGQWTNVERMHYLLNSPQHEKLLGFNKNGSILYYFKGWKMNSGSIVVDTFTTIENRKLNSTPLNGPESLTQGDVSMTLYNDTLLIFSSRKGGGFGGKDLYKSVYKNGAWSFPKNLGEQINTPYDETSPFLSPDGKTLYFSSNDSQKSIGGYDIFRSVYIRHLQKWSSPMNVGVPLNSAGDETGFILAKDGFTAFFDSSRKDGFGKRDVYIAYFQTHLDEIEAPAFVYNPPPVFTTPPNHLEETPINDLPIVLENTNPVFTEEFEETNTFPAETIPDTSTPEANEKAYTTLFFDNHTQRLSTRQQQSLEPIVTALIENPAVTLIITAYTNASEKVPNRLFQAINYAEKTARYLQSKGVASSSIYMRALDGSKSKESSPFLLEFAFTGTKNTVLEDNTPVIGISNPSSFSNFTPNKALCYKIQFTSVLKASKKPILNTAPYPMIEKTLDFKYYRYTLGAFENYNEAINFSKEMKKLGFKGAYVVPFLYGKRANTTTVKRSLVEFPDLNHYLKG